MQCPSVRTLSYIIGGLNLFFSALLTVRVFVELIVFSHEEAESKNDDFIDQAIFRYGLDTLITSLFIGVVWLIFSVLLVKGIHQERYQLMSCWIYMNYVLLAVVFGICGVAFAMDVYHWSSFKDIILNLFLYILISGLSFAIFYPVFALYRSMQLPPLPSEHQPLKSAAGPPVTGMSFDVRGDEF